MSVKKENRAYRVLCDRQALLFYLFFCCPVIKFGYYCLFKTATKLFAVV